MKSLKNDNIVSKLCFGNNSLRRDEYERLSICIHFISNCWVIELVSTFSVLHGKDAWAPDHSHEIKLFMQLENLNLHFEEFHVENTHHVIEAMFKAFSKALDSAVYVDERIPGLLSTKGSL